MNFSLQSKYRKQYYIYQFCLVITAKGNLSLPRNCSEVNLVVMYSKLLYNKKMFTTI